MRKSCVVAAATILGGAMGWSWASPAAVAGPVQILSQDRRITATARPGAGAANVVDEITAPDNGAFNETATVDASGDGFVSRATSTVQSTMGNDGFHIKGTLSWGSQDTRAPASVDSATANAAVLHDIFFRLDQPYDFTFTEILNKTDDNDLGSEIGENFTFLSFGQGGFGVGASGTLQPGDYNLRYSRDTGSNVSGDTLATFALEYDVNLNLTPHGNGGSGPPPAVPLPPAAWAGLLTFACYGVCTLRRRDGIAEERRSVWRASVRLRPVRCLVRPSAAA